MSGPTVTFGDIKFEMMGESTNLEDRNFDQLGLVL